MGMKPIKQRPSFFKVLINMDFTRKLRIPLAFSKKYGQCLRGENVTLRISCGKTWDVKVKKCEDTGNYNYKFTKGGWNKFAKDVGLEFGEFLVFWLVGKSMFDVSIYQVTGCEREIPVNKFQDDDVISNKQYSKTLMMNGGGALKPDHSFVSEQINPLYFEIHMKKHQKSRLTLGKRFWTAAGLTGKETVCLVYLPKRRYQTVVLDHKPASYRVDMTAGWSEFRKANGLVIGKPYSFEFKPRKNVIQVQELKTIII